MPKKINALVVDHTAYTIPLTKKQERLLDRGMRPYDSEFEGWTKVVSALEDLGAFNVDRGVYGGLEFSTRTKAEAEAVLGYIETRLGSPTKRSSVPSESGGTKHPGERGQESIQDMITRLLEVEEPEVLNPVTASSPPPRVGL